MASRAKEQQIWGDRLWTEGDGGGKSRLGMSLLGQLNPEGNTCWQPQCLAFDSRFGKFGPGQITESRCVNGFYFLEFRWLLFPRISTRYTDTEGSCLHSPTVGAFLALSSFTISRADIVFTHARISWFDGSHSCCSPAQSRAEEGWPFSHHSLCTGR